MNNLGKQQPGSTFEVWFDSFAATGGSITMSGFALADIKVYKNGNTTPRASTSGFTLLDTDGIDIAAITGIHGFSINLADNSTAGFWVSGARYTVVISTITVDSQTISFVAAQFTIGEVGALLDTTLATVASQTSFTLTDGPPDNDALNGCVVVIHDKAHATQQCLGVVWDYLGSSKTVALLSDPKVFGYEAGDNISFLPDRSLKPSVDNRIADVGSSGEVISAVYDDGAVWLDTVNGVPGTVPYVNGMADYPVSSWANALTLAAALRLNRIRIAAGSSVTLTATLANLQLVGRNWSLNLGTQALTGAYIEGATLTGTATASGALPVFRDCAFGTQTLPPLLALHCSLGTTLTLGSAGEYNFVDCYNSVSVGSNCTISVGSAASSVRLANWTGAIRFTNMTNGSSQLDISGRGKITLVGSCTNGLVTIAGEFDLADSSTVATLIDTARRAEDQNVAYVEGKILGNDLGGGAIADEGAWVSGHDGWPLPRGVGVLSASQADSGTTTSLTDAARTEPYVDFWKGHLLVIKGGTMVGMTRIINGFDPSTDTLSFRLPLPLAITNETYEIWPTGADSSMIADAVWDEPTFRHPTAGTTGLALTSAGTAGDPWGTALPGAYSAGTAGKLLSDAHNRIGAFTGTGDNTILGFLKSIMRFDVTTPSDVGGTYDSVFHSLEILYAANITIFGNLSTLQADTDNIQTRLPAALVGGRMDASVGAMAANVLTSSATDGTYVTEVQNGLATSAQATSLAVDIADIQTRLPAALVSGRMDASVGAMAANVLTAAAMDSTASEGIADAVWNELLAGHLTAGSAGLALSTASSGGVDPSILADAVWDEVLSGHLTPGTTGEQLNEAGGITPSTATMIADYVLRRHWQTAYDSSNGDDPTSGRTLLGMMARFVNRWEVVGANLVLYLGDDATVFLTVPLSTVADADQITGMDPPA